MQKYDPKGPFNDPIVRCTECQYLITRDQIRISGGCPKCGCKKVRNNLTLDDKEMDKLKNMGIDPDYLALFEPAGVQE